MTTQPKLTLLLEFIFTFIFSHLLLLKTTTYSSAITTITHHYISPLSSLTNHINHRPQYYPLIQSNKHINYKTPNTPQILVHGRLLNDESNTNITTPINYLQHYHQTHNTPITIKSTITTPSTYGPITSITSITTSYNQLLHIPNTISYGPFTSTNQITCINSHVSIIN
eukprot:485983_1